MKELDPIDDMEIEYDPDTDKMDIGELIKAKTKIGDELLGQKFDSISQAQMLQYKDKVAAKEQIEELEDEIKKTTKMIMNNDLINMKRVMRRLDMVDKNDVPMLKGKVAAGLSAADEILTTELIFSGFF